MRYLVPIFLLIISGLSLDGQNVNKPDEGYVTYVTSQNVYVQFKSTADISKGDTLFILQGDQLIPALKVTDLSSISCVCIPLINTPMTVSEKVVHMKMNPHPAKKEEAIVAPEKPVPAVQPKDTLTTGKTLQKKSSQQIHGFLTVASYSDFSNTSVSNSQRMRYTFSLNARDIGNSKLSAECYVSYLQDDHLWSEVKKNIFTSLKIYDLALSYEFSPKVALWLGRKINPKLSNMGANDGLQLEMRFKPVSMGIIGGFRPDYSDYGFNAKLFQVGGYLYNEMANKNGFMQSTLAIIDQTNSWKTDRRFLYLQHANSLLKNLFFFGTAEFDLYKKVFNAPDSTYKGVNSPWLSNLYLSLNWRPARWLSLSVSYSERQNPIYYETYKSYLDKLIDNATLQGYQGQISCRPVKNLSIGVNAGYRSEKKDLRPSKNVYGYLTYSQIPGIGVSATLSVTWLETSYISGKFYGAGISRDIIPGKLFIGLDYRYVDYRYYNAEITELQNMGEANLTWRMIRKLSFSVYYEGTFEKKNQFTRIYAQLNFCF